MAMIYNADEVFKMGEQIERNGCRFYARAAEQSDEAGVKQLLRRLADMEAEHETLFADMRREISRQGAAQVDYDPDNDVSRYLQASADSHVFNVRGGLESLLTGQESAPEVLRLALGFEKDSVVFFLGIRELVPAELGKDRIDWLIRQEMAHITDLASQLRSLEG